MIRTVLTHPNPKLRQISAEVMNEEITQHDFQIGCDDLIETLRAERGVGIAAPQVALFQRIIVVCDDPKEADKPVIYVNPQIVGRSFRKKLGEEGCLSIPGKVGTVKRHRSVRVQALDRYGKKITVRASGLQAVVFQHEMDHLDGILFIDRAVRVHEAPRM
jgi:peptide deformylase